MHRGKHNLQFNFQGSFLTFLTFYKYYIIIFIESQIFYFAFSQNQDAPREGAKYYIPLIYGVSFFSHYPCGSPYSSYSSIRSKANHILLSTRNFPQYLLTRRAYCKSTFGASADTSSPLAASSVHSGRCEHLLICF